MKQFAIALAAILATSAFAQEDGEDDERPFVLKLAYAAPENLFLGLEADNPVTLALPRRRCERGGTLAGWLLDDLAEDADSVDYDDFSINVITKEGNRGKSRSFYEFVPAADGILGEVQDITFTYTCGERDEDGNEVVTSTDQITIGVAVTGDSAL